MSRRGNIYDNRLRVAARALGIGVKPVLFYRVTRSGRWKLNASRFTPRSSLIRLCGSSATLKANADGRGTGTRGPITTNLKLHRMPRSPSPSHLWRRRRVPEERPRPPPIHWGPILFI